MTGKNNFLSGRKISPQPIGAKTSLTDLVDNSLLAYNGARLREGCKLFTEKMLAADVTVGMSLTGALTPAGLGMSCIIPLIENGFVDWIVNHRPANSDGLRPGQTFTQNTQKSVYAQGRDVREVEQRNDDIT